MNKYAMLFLAIVVNCFGAAATVYVNGTTITTGAARAASANSITLATDAPTESLVGYGIQINAGTGYATAGNSRIILTYNGDTKVATVDTWTQTPASDCTYEVTVGSDVTNTGDTAAKGHAFASIQKALSAVGSPVTVNITPATYEEPDYGYLYLIAGMNGDIFTFQPNTATAGNVTIIGNGTYCVRSGAAWTSGTARLYNLKLTPTTYATQGIAVEHAGATLIVDTCTITNDGGAADASGIIASASGTGTSSLCLYHNTIVNSYEGIHLSSYLAATSGIIDIWDNTVVNDKDTAGGTGASIQIGVGAAATTNTNPVGRAIIRNNTVRFTGDLTEISSAIGILVGSGADKTTVYMNDSEGITAYSIRGENVSFTYNLGPASMPGGGGLTISGSSGGYYAFNTIRNSVSTGCALLSSIDGSAVSAYNVVEYNILDGGPGYALYVDDPTSPQSYDYNVYRSHESATCPISIGGSITATIEAAQSEWTDGLSWSTNDTHSIIANPNFNGDYLPTNPTLYDDTRYLQKYGRPIAQ